MINDETDPPKKKSRLKPPFQFNPEPLNAADAFCANQANRAHRAPWQRVAEQRAEA
jgi:hypothetical protein